MQTCLSRTLVTMSAQCPTAVIYAFNTETADRSHNFLHWNITSRNAIQDARANRHFEWLSMCGEIDVPPLGLSVVVLWCRNRQTWSIIYIIQRHSARWGIFSWKQLRIAAPLRINCLKWWRHRSATKFALIRPTLSSKCSNNVNVIERWLWAGLQFNTDVERSKIDVNLERELFTS